MGDMEGEIFIIDIDGANRLLDEQRRVIAEVARRCFFKGKNHLCLACPVWDACEAKNHSWEVKNHAAYRG
jgi:hypothetical protein